MVRSDTLNGLEEIYKVMKIIMENEEDDNKPPIPLFSFEGLPGAGKTTQIKRVAQRMEHEYGKAYYIDLPTKSPIGKILKSLYSDENRWHEIRRNNPWLNPMMTSVDLRVTMQEAIEKGAQYALMSRGILSTYYYNLDAYGQGELDSLWYQMEEHMKAFYRPTAIIFMDISEEQAYERVVKRNRGPLRKMDQVAQMKKDRIIFEEYIKRIGNIPVHYIDASGNEEQVTEIIIRQLETYMEMV